MHYAYDGDAQAAYVTLTDKPVARTIPITANSQLDLDADGNAVGLELLHVPIGQPVTL